MEDVREQLLAMVRLEREAGHLLSAMQHVVTIATGLQGEESQEVSVASSSFVVV